VLLFYLLTPPRERGNFLSFLLGMLMSSGRGGRYDRGWGSGSGGGWSDGGGFSGGGGSSGGGGASGSW
jgi:uncharacterized protein